MLQYFWQNTVEAVNRRRLANNTMAKRKKTEGQTTIYKSISVDARHIFRKGELSHCADGNKK